MQAGLADDLADVVMVVPDLPGPGPPVRIVAEDGRAADLLIRAHVQVGRPYFLVSTEVNLDSSGPGP